MTIQRVRASFLKVFVSCVVAMAALAVVAPAAFAQTPSEPGTATVDPATASLESSDAIRPPAPPAPTDIDPASAPVDLVPPTDQSPANDDPEPANETPPADAPTEVQPAEPIAPSAPADETTPPEATSPKPLLPEPMPPTEITEPTAPAEPGTSTEPSGPATATPPNENALRLTFEKSYFPDVNVEYLQQIRQDMPLLNVELKAWFNLLEVLQHADGRRLAEYDVGPVTYDKLMKYSADYSGRVVTVRGTTRWVFEIPAPNNTLGISKHYQIWLVPDGEPDSFLVLICLTLPEGFPQPSTSGRLIERIEATGFFFKRWAFREGETEVVAPSIFTQSIKWLQGEAPPVVEPTREPKEEENFVVARARDLFRLGGIDDSYFAFLESGRPLGPDEHETLLKLLYRVDEMSTDLVAKWIYDKLDLAELARSPESYRGEFFPLTGTVLSVKPFRPSEEAAFVLDFNTYYRCEVKLDSGNEATIYTLRVPDAWKKGLPAENVGDAVGGEGVFLKFTSEDPAQRRPIFVARRLKWWPDTWLGRLGMDVGLLDEVRIVSRFESADREPFYQMLAAVGRTEPGELLEQAVARFNEDEAKRLEAGEKASEQISDSVVPLFNEPDSCRGKLFVLTGKAKSVKKILLNDPILEQQLGIDHYYQIGLFPNDSQNNPIFFCVSELPEGLPLSADDTYRERLRIAGFFYKKWAYSRLMTDEEKQERDAKLAEGASQAEANKPPIQLAPLLIGRDAQWLKADDSPASIWWGIAGGIFFALLIVGVWISVWIASKGDKQFYEQTLSRIHAVDEDTSLDEAGLVAETEPDFEAIAAADTSSKRDQDKKDKEGDKQDES